MITYPVTVLPGGRILQAAPGQDLLSLLRREGLVSSAPCGGHGSCGKCRVRIQDREVLSCQTKVTGPVTVTLPQPGNSDRVVTWGVSAFAPVDPVRPGRWHLAYDIGTTTVACYVLDGESGRELAAAGAQNPQQSFGSDVISRIQGALRGELDALTGLIRQCMTDLAEGLCRRIGADPKEIGTVAVVGNPCMQQLFLGISPENLARIPFAPVLTRGQTLPAREYLPLCANAALLVVPDISGYVGADTVACLLASGQPESGQPLLLVDIGTNGELVMGGRQAMVACSTAAGPALEGAGIRFGMGCAEGAIDRVWLEDGRIRCHVVGEGPALGICGSGLIDAVAALLEAGMVNRRGRIQPADGEGLKEVDGQRVCFLTETVYLTQQDIRQVQLAKGAIAAGILLMARTLGISPEELREVQLAGAFGSAIRPESAARIGLIPPGLSDRVRPLGNAAGSGAKLLALNRRYLTQAEALVRRIRPLELAQMPEFQRTFAEQMRFP